VALRPHAAPVVSTVHSISGETTAGIETFTVGDPLIGQEVNFGADTYFAGNNPQAFGDAMPEEYWGAALEPLGLFELHFGAMFSGVSQVGPFVAKAAAINTLTRTPDSRPIADGLDPAGAELAEFALPDLTTWSEARIALLVADYNALPAGPSPERRNLVRRISHLFPRVSAATRNAITAANPGVFTSRAGTLTAGWDNKEVYDGKVDEALTFQPGVRGMVAYMSEFTSFDVNWNPFAFHSDELCGYHIGSLTPDLDFHTDYTGDPHTRTVNGVRYDFQAVGEFTLLRDGDRMEIQSRQTPVATQNPITDSYTGLTACVSINTAIAARLGRHRISLQPGREGRRLQFYVDGKPADLPKDGLDLDRHRVTTFDANGEPGLRVDFEDGTVLIVTPHFWNSHSVWYMNVNVSHTRAHEGVMGLIPRRSWLPRLRDGSSLGPMPASLQDRYVALYKKFADSWRVTDQTSLFVYESGTSTKTFTDQDWPAAQPPCRIKPHLQIPNAPLLRGMPVAEAERICKPVTMKDLHANCVFDVATTGDKTFAEGYLLAQELRLYGTSVTLTAIEPPARSDRQPGDEPPPERRDHALRLTATVAAVTAGRPRPTGSVTFHVDGVAMRRPVTLDERGRARLVVPRLKPGTHTIRATYSGGGKYDYHGSSSATLVFSVGRQGDDRVAPA
jgi:hypothetical protein